MSFSGDIRKFARKTNTNAGEVARALKIQLFGSIIFETRVDEGRLRGNWQTSTGQPKFGVVDRVDKFEMGQVGGKAYQEMLDNVTDNGVDYMTNNLPYAEVWEERDGMVAKNIVRVQRNLKEAVQGVN